MRCKGDADLHPHSIWLPKHPPGDQDVNSDRHQSLSSSRAWEQWAAGSYLYNHHSPFAECPAGVRGVDRVDAGERKIQETSFCFFNLPKSLLALDFIKELFQSTISKSRV